MAPVVFDSVIKANIAVFEFQRVTPIRVFGVERRNIRAKAVFLGQFKRCRHFLAPFLWLLVLVGLFVPLLNIHYGVIEKQFYFFPNR
jgi:hypothetical protein